MGSGGVPGPAPITIFDESITFPDPPDPPAVSAQVTIGLDAAGFGTLAATDVVLGTFVIDLGRPFGEQEVDITSLRIAGTITITAETCPWDLDGNGSVGITDLLALLAAWGTDPGGPPDFDGDGNVGVTDLLTLLANWGPCA